MNGSGRLWANNPEDDNKLTVLVLLFMIVYLVEATGATVCLTHMSCGSEWVKDFQPSDMRLISYLTLESALSFQEKNRQEAHTPPHKMV